MRSLHASAFFLLAAICSLALVRCASDAPAPPEPLGTPSWQMQTSDSEALFIGLSAASADVAWASGTLGTFARTVDGGTTWQTGRVPGADSLQFRDVHAVDAETAYLLSAATGDDSRIYKTTDAGQSWTLQFTNPYPTGFFSCFAFWDSQRGVAFSDQVDGQIPVIRTEDGGATWTRIPEANIPPARDGEGGFAASGTCIVTQPDGYAWIGTGAAGAADSTAMARVFRSTDFGQTWSVHNTPIPSSSGTSGIFSLTFRDAQHGAALGGDFALTDQRSQNVALTSDGGQTWELVGSTNLTGSVFGSAYVPGAESPALVAVAPTGSDFSRDEGRTWTRIDTTNYWTVHAYDASTIWAAGPDGRIARVAWE